MPSHNDDVILTHLDYIRGGIDALHVKVDAQNGRLRDAETAITVLETRAGEAKTSGRNWGAASGTAGGFLGGFVSSLFQRFLGGSPQ